MTGKTISNFISDGASASLVSKNQLQNLKERKFCAACNNGWMSRLESKVKPIFLDLVAGNIQPCNLSRAQRVALARWAAKTAIVLSHAVGSEQTIDPVYLRRMQEDENGGPLGAVVFITHLTFNEAPKIMWAKTDGASPMFVGTAAHSTIPKVGMLLGPILLIVAFPIPKITWKIRIAAGAYVPIWPDAEFSCRFVEFQGQVEIKLVIKMLLDTIEVAVEQSTTKRVLIPTG